MSDLNQLERELEEACGRAVADDAEALVIGGGPLAVVARRLAQRIPVPVVEPVPAAARLVMARAQVRPLVR
jgi:Asp/Glu/hydantoin racemase